MQKLWPILTLLIAMCLSAPAKGLDPAGAERCPVPAPVASHAGPSQAEAPVGRTEEGHKPWNPPVWAVIPFVLMLLCIAVIPLINEHWWENDRHRGAVSLVLGVPVLLYVLLAGHHGGHLILHTGEEYVAFIVLLGSLFVISGGIVITGNLVGTPLVNTAFLATGGVLASFIGTTGAAMVLIRPVLTTNKERKHKLHTVIFFIFIVCNCGGCLTPLGDPPLFLGYLKGVPFAWTFSLVKEWAFVVAVLLVVYFVFDVVQAKKETKRDIKLDVTHERPLVVLGAHNFLFLGGVVFAVAAQLPFGLREFVMIVMTLLAWGTTRPDYRKTNGFHFGPIQEVAIVFLGIFSTMIPALALLNARGAELGVTDPHQFFWMTGSLSAFLDNAPTYVSFLALANGVGAWGDVLTHDVISFAAGHPAFVGTWEQAQAHARSLPSGVEIFVIPQPILAAISLGSVFLGSMTYIGNGPNFMVRAIADKSGVRMPSFFGYLLWSVCLLTPVFFLTTQLFL